MVLKFPIFTLSPIITLSSITLYGPISTLLPIFAELDIIFVWCILLIFDSYLSTIEAKNSALATSLSLT